MTRGQLENIIESAPATIQHLLGEIAADILDAAPQTLADDGTGKLKIAVGITINLKTSPPVWHAEAAVSVKHKAVSAAVETQENTPYMPGFEN